MQDIMLTFSGLLYLIYCDNLANFYRILRWVMSKLVSLDMEWPSYEALVWKEALTICQDRLFGSCLYVLSLSSVLGSFIHMYCDTGSLGKCTPASGNQKFYGGSFLPDWEPEEEWFWQSEPFLKLKTALCEYWTSIKIKINK